MLEGYHSNVSIASLILGIIGLVTIFIPFINFGSIILAILAVIFGYMGYWGEGKTDKYALIGFILGIIVIILFIGTILLAGFVYLYVSNMTGGP